MPTLASAFQHPGLLNSAAELDEIRAKVQAGTNPWAQAYQTVPSSASAHPGSVLSGGGASSGNFFQDGYGAYALALRWVVTQDPSDAQASAKILQAWATTLKVVTNTPQNYLTVSWSLAPYLYAAEILRSSPASAPAFPSFVKHLLPYVQQADVHGGGTSDKNNWAAFGARTRMAIGVYLDDAGVFQQGVQAATAMIGFYIGTFGHPVGAGFTYETCRIPSSPGGMGTLLGGDLQHTQYGLGALVEAAEIGKHQGVDLYGASGASLSTALTYHAAFVAGGSGQGWPCKLPLGSINRSAEWMPWQMAAHHYGASAIQQVAQSVGVDAGVVTGARWSALTHAGQGGVFGPPGGDPTPGPLPPPWNVHLVVK